MDGLQFQIDGELTQNCEVQVEERKTMDEWGIVAYQISTPSINVVDGYNFRIDGEFTQNCVVLAKERKTMDEWGIVACKDIYSSLEWVKNITMSLH